MIRSPIRVNNGVVLIVVLLIFAATTALVVSMQVKFVDTARLQAAISMSAQAHSYHEGAELLAGLQLRADALTDLQEDRVLDSPTEPWGQPENFPIDGGEIRTQLVDLHGRLNLTGIENDPERQAVFIRLLAELGIPRDKSISQQDLFAVLLDWIDVDQLQAGFVQSEDDYYASLGQAGAEKGFGYLTGQAPLHHLSEFLLLHGISKTDYVELSQHVAFLPLSAKLNINSVSLPLARALNQSAGAELVSNRPSEGYTSEDGRGLSASVRPLISYDVVSEYFELRVEVVFGDVRSQQTALIYMPPLEAGQTAEDAPFPQVLERDASWAYYYSL